MKLQIIIMSGLIVRSQSYSLSTYYTFEKICRIHRDNRISSKLREVDVMKACLRGQQGFGHKHIFIENTRPRYFMNHNSDNSAQVFTKPKMARVVSAWP